MRISIQKFGSSLISRPAGKEAYLAYQPVAKTIRPSEEIIMDFQGVSVLTPSWADEFITPFIGSRPGRVRFENTGNPSVLATLEVLGKNWKSG